MLNRFGLLAPGYSHCARCQRKAACPKQAAAWGHSAPPVVHVEPSLTK
jgi:hypothetical protein